MSGGHFDYKNYYLTNISDDIQKVIDNNTTPDCWGYARNYSEETIKEFKVAIALLKLASIFIHRIDYLLEGDDSEENFHKRLIEDIQNAS